MTRAPDRCPDCGRESGAHAWGCSILVRLCAVTLAADDPDGWRERCRRIADRPGDEGAHWREVAITDPVGSPVELEPVDGGLAERFDPMYNLPGSRELFARLMTIGSETLVGAEMLPVLFEA